MDEVPVLKAVGIDSADTRPIFELWGGLPERERATLHALALELGNALSTASTAEEARSRACLIVDQQSIALSRSVREYLASLTKDLWEDGTWAARSVVLNLIARLPLTGPSYFVTESDDLVRLENEHLGLPRTEQQCNTKITLPRTGIALSGGGIRAAIVAIGALQALAALDLLKRFDTISGVSGGGYAASALQWWWSERRRREQPSGSASPEDDFGTAPQNFPYGSRHPNPQMAGVGQETKLQGEVLAFLRWHGSYLIPGGGITAASGIAVVLRTLFLNLVVWIPLMTLAYIVINWAGYLSCAYWHNFCSNLWPPLGDIIPLMGSNGFTAPPNEADFLNVSLTVPHELTAPPNEKQFFTTLSENLTSLLQTSSKVLPSSVKSALRQGLPYSLAIWGSYLIVVGFAAVAIAVALLSRRSYDIQVRASLPIWMGKFVVGLFLLLSAAYLSVRAIALGLSDTNFSLLLVAFLALLVGLAFVVWAISDALAYIQTSYIQALNAAYVLRRRFEIWAGRFFVPTLVLFVFGTVPIVPYYLHLIGNSKSLSVGTAIVTTISGIASSLYGHYAIVQNVVPGLTARILAAFGAAVFLYSLAILSYLISVIFLVSLNADPSPAHVVTSVDPLVWKVILCSIALSLALCFCVNINNVSLHRFYRDRLMEAFMPDKKSVENERVDYATGADRILLSDLMQRTTEEGDRIPYLVLSANAILVNDENRKFSSRGGDSFLLSPLFIGSQATGWRRTEAYQKTHGPLTLASATAASGASANARAGYVGKGLTRDRLVSAVMTLLNMRLGLWVANPSSARRKVPGYFSPVLTYGLFGKILENGYRSNSKFIELSDGGHFENLGLYELVRRKTKVILVIDAEQDQNLSFPAFVSAIGRIRTDFHAVVEFESNKGPEYLSPDLTLKFPHGAPCASQPYFACRINYDGKMFGTLIYLKSALIKDLSMTALGYRSENADFPSQSTLNQFFVPPQFEAYRELGFQSVVIAAEALQLDATITNPADLWDKYVKSSA